MSLFQCGHCGCCDNTATGGGRLCREDPDLFDWSGIEDRKGLELCCACAPTKYIDGVETGYGRWHGLFNRVFLPMSMFKTASNGNLEHKVTRSQNYQA